MPPLGGDVWFEPFKARMHFAPSLLRCGPFMWLHACTLSFDVVTCMYIVFNLLLRAPPPLCPQVSAGVRFMGAGYGQFPLLGAELLDDVMIEFRTTQLAASLLELDSVVCTHSIPCTIVFHSIPWDHHFSFPRETVVPPPVFQRLYFQNVYSEKISFMPRTTFVCWSTSTFSISSLQYQ